MSTINGKSYQDPRNINLKGGELGTGLIRWRPPTSGAVAQNWSTNPFSTDDYGLYVNSSGQLVYSSTGTTTVLGAAGSGGPTPSFNAIYNGSQTLTVSATTFTIDGTHASNNVLTVSDTGAGSGHLIQITNTGTGKDIRGTSGTWDVSALGAITGLSLVLAGTAATTSLTLTLGNIVTSAGGLSLTKAANNATLTVTNNTATTASVIVLAGSGTFTGSTTTSFMTLTPSGLTTGTALYIPVAALTTGKAVHVVANAVTDGLVVNITSSSTVLTSTGRLFKVDHTGSTGVSTIIAEVASAATDETVIFKVTASGALALGTAFVVSGSSVTTGKAITANDLDALTTGMGVHIASAATAITTTGRMFLSDHTGTTGTSATLNEFKSAANDETIVLAVTAASLTTGSLIAVTSTGITTGKILDLGTATALTTGTGIILAHTTTVIADGGSMIRLSSTGINTGGATNGTMLDVQTTAQVAGTQVLFKAGAVTTGVVLSVISTTGMTSGSLIRATSSTAGAIATNGAISFRATGAFTSTTVGFVDILASAAVAGTSFSVTNSAASQTTGIAMQVIQSGTTTGYSGSVVSFTGSHTTGGNTLLITDVTTTTGNAVSIVSNALIAGTSTALIVSHTTSVLGAGNSLVRISSTGVDTGTTTGVLLDLSTSAAAGSTQILLTDSSTDTALRVGIFSKITNAAAVLAVPLKTSNVAVVNSKFTKHMQLTDGTKTVAIWISQDNTDPNTVLTGVKGDICLNSVGGYIAVCTANGTSWTTMS